STDNTSELVEGWQSQMPFPIRYFWQPNDHKKTAFNRGVKEAAGEFFLTLDSDDEALPDALKILNSHWCNIPESERHGFSAVTGLCIDEKGGVIGERFPEDVIDSNSLEIFHRFRITGEKFGFQKTEVLRQFPFPEDVHGHVPEGIIWSRISVKYKTRFVNVPVRCFHFDAGESITRTLSSHTVYADGHALWAREVLCNEWRWFSYNPKWFLKMAANYTRFHMHLQKSQPGKRWLLKEFVPRLLMVLMWPVGLMLYWVDKIKASNG
ncbi:MAG: glycosyltransferase family 2 protein, partial [Desulfobacteraceae bacterium]|nr:glycosyltransferase family 2 protein [Desulfobacteraceae bacterium]